MNTPRNFVNRLREWRERKNLSQAAAAALLDVTRSYLNQIENGREPGAALVKKFEEIVNVSRKSEQQVVNPHTVSPGRKIPLISWAKAGEAVAFEDVVDWDNLIETDVRDPKAIAVCIRGDSMEPRISDGDIVILLCSEKPRQGDIVVARLKDDGVICKIFHLTGPDGRTFRLSSYNPAYPAIDLTEDDFSWIYPVGEQKRIYRR